MVSNSKLDNLDNLVSEELLDIKDFSFDIPVGTEYELPFDSTKYDVIAVLAYEKYYTVTDMKYQAHWNKRDDRIFMFHHKNKYTVNLKIIRDRNVLLIDKNDIINVDRDTWLYQITVWGLFKKV